MSDRRSGCEVSGSSVEAELHGLRREKEAAEAASAAKSRYLASVSHEIRAPLNSIYGYAQLLERGGAVDPVEAARVIRRSAEHLTNLVEGLVDIAQIENGVLRISKDVVRLPQFLDQVASMVRQQAEAKGLCFVYGRPAALPELVRMDESRLRQALINLLTNAIKFTAEGSVGFKVAWAGQTAVFEISDTGPGIAAEDREAVFEPFRRGSGAAVQAQAGVGLGLAITQAIVHILGGELAMTSEPGAGTTFRVRMMMTQVAGQAGEVPAATRIQGYEGRRRAILAVDDDPEQLRLVETLLRPLGFDVTVAASGAAALALSVTQAFDLALLDIAMPGLSGWKTAERLRARCGQGLRIVMLSANAHERHRPQADEPVHDQFLLKPVGLDALVELIGQELGLRWTVAAATGEPVRGGVSDEALPETAGPIVAAIRESVRIGHVRGIEGEIKRLAATGPEAGALCARLFACLDRYDFAGLARALERRG